MKTPKHITDESKINTLSSLEHPAAHGMYRAMNGSNPDDGCYILRKEAR